MSKQRWRETLTRDRASVPAEQRALQAHSLTRLALEFVAGTGARTVCCYVPVGEEPGELELLDRLHETGVEVLLPIVVGKGPLEWARYTGPDSLERAAFGLLEPNGERLSAEAVGRAEVVFVPALAVDHQGIRLGKGAGYYDRSLSAARPDVELVAVIGDTEFVEALPGEEHDVRMTAVMTPERGVVRLPV